MKKMVIFGATGGLGKKLIPLLRNNYEIIPLGSKLVNITYFREVQQFFEKETIDIVLNMSGKSHDVYLSKISDKDYQSIIDMINVNIIGNINILLACLPHMIKNRWGRIIMISSILSVQNIPKTSIYSASKAFLDRLISVANKENINYGITCNTIQLGYFEGGMSEKLDPEFSEKIKKSINRFGKIEELYNTINYIVENEYVSGTNLKIDGGL